MKNENVIFISISIIALIFELSSCDCRQTASGIVADKTTRLPIDSVYIHKTDGDSVYSDSLGNFKIEAISGGLLGCPLMALEFSKKNYRTNTRQIGNEKDSIFLEKVTSN